VRPSTQSLNSFIANICLAVFSDVASLGTSPLRVTLYCNEEHIQEVPGLRGWYDTAYTVNNPNDDAWNYKPFVKVLGPPDGSKPGTGGDYTTHGEI
jgi:hypothetical protein